MTQVHLCLFLSKFLLFMLNIDVPFVSLFFAHHSLISETSQCVNLPFIAIYHVPPHKTIAFLLIYFCLPLDLVCYFVNSYMSFACAYGRDLE